MPSTPTPPRRPPRPVPLPPGAAELLRTLGPDGWSLGWGRAVVRGNGPRVESLELDGRPALEGLVWDPEDLDGDSAYRALPGRLELPLKAGGHALILLPARAPVGVVIAPAEALGRARVLEVPGVEVLRMEAGEAGSQALVLAVGATAGEAREALNAQLRAVPMHATRPLQRSLSVVQDGLSMGLGDGDTPLAGLPMALGWAATGAATADILPAGRDPLSAVLAGLGLGLERPSGDLILEIMDRDPEAGLLSASAVGAWFGLPEFIEGILQALMDRGPALAKAARESERARLGLLGVAAALEGAGHGGEADKLKFFAGPRNGGTDPGVDLRTRAALPPVVGARPAPRPGRDGMTAGQLLDDLSARASSGGGVDREQGGGPRGETGLDLGDPEFLALPLLLEFAGARADAAYGRLHLSPRIPEEVETFWIRGIPLGPAKVDLRYRRKESIHTFELIQRGGGVPVTVLLEPALPENPSAQVPLEGPRVVEFEARTQSGFTST